MRFVEKFFILDWVMVLLVLGIGLLIDFLPFPGDFHPYIVSDIDNAARTSTIPFDYFCIFTFGLGALFVVVIWCTVSIGPSISGVLASYYFSLSLAILVGCVFKRMVGRPRPDTIAQCGGNGTFGQCKKVLSGAALSDQFQSFPSGHACESMAVAVFMTMLLMMVWDNFSMFGSLVKTLPIMISILVGCTRITDRAHHVDDVVAGWVIGGIIGYVVFKTFHQKVRNMQ